MSKENRMKFMKQNKMVLFFGLATCTIITFFLLAIQGCDNSCGPEPQYKNQHDAIFGFSVNKNHFFIQTVTDEGLGEEMDSGDIGEVLGAKVNNGGVIPSTVAMSKIVAEGGKQFIIRQDDTGSWFIHKILDSGLMGYQTDDGQWDHVYTTLAGARLGDKGYLFGQRKDGAGTSWFIREILPDGTLGEVRAQGGLDDWISKAVVIEREGLSPLLFRHKEEDGNWALHHVRESGLSDSISTGNYPFHLTLTPFSVDDKSYLFGQSQTGEWGVRMVTEAGISDYTDSGVWETYYNTAVAYTYNERTFLFLQTHDDNSWQIREVLPGGIMGSQFGLGGQEASSYNYVFPLSVAPNYLYNWKWMTVNYDLIKDKTLHEISIPGSHDTGMDDSTCDEVSSYGLPCATQTQKKNIYGQLLSGARYMDIRPCRYYYSDYHGDWKWYLGHWEADTALGYVGCMGESFGTALDLVKYYFSYLDMAAPGHKELLILNFSHAYDITNEPFYYRGNDMDSHGWNRMVEIATDKLSPYILSLPDDFDIEKTTYEELMKGGGGVIIRVESDYDDVETDIDNGVIKADEFKIYNHYANTNDSDSMIFYQLARLKLSASHYKQLYTLSWTLTLSSADLVGCNTIFYPSILHYAGGANEKLNVFIDFWVQLNWINETNFVNIVYVDDFGPSATWAAIYLNTLY